MTKLGSDKINLSMPLPGDFEWEETVIKDNRMVYGKWAVGWDEKVKLCAVRP